MGRDRVGERGGGGGGGVGGKVFVCAFRGGRGGPGRDDAISYFQVTVKFNYEVTTNEKKTDDV